MTTYNSPFVVGQRVALMPHLDLWMAGVRFGEISSIEAGSTDADTGYGVKANGRVYWFDEADIRAIPEEQYLGDSNALTEEESAEVKPDRVLSVPMLVTLSTILTAASQSQPVRWTNGEGETIHTGTVRSIGRQDFTFIRGDEDVRDAFLRITTRGGTELAMPMAEVVALIGGGSMAFG